MRSFSPFLKVSLFVLVFTCVAHAQMSVWRVSTSTPNATRDLLEQNGFDVAGADQVLQHVDVVGGPQTPMMLQSFGLCGTSMGEEAPFADLAPFLSSPSDIPAGYRTTAQLQAAAVALAATYPNLCVLHDLNLNYAKPNTAGGRTIKALKISDNPQVNEDEPNVLLVALHHARELNTAEVAMDHATRLLSQYATNSQVQGWVNNYEIWITWSFNPDGHEYVWTNNSLWRKNRRLITGSTYGVDLNRNYSLGWSSTCAGSTSPSNETYKGSSAMSEVETQVMQAFAHDRRFAKLIDFHSYGRDILYTYLCTPFPATLETWYQSEAVSLALACGWTALDTRKSSAEGEHFQWEIWRYGTHAFLVELGTAFQPAYSEVTTESNSTWGGVQWILNRPIPISGHVHDACTGLPIVANLSISGIAYSAGEIRESSPRDGRYHLFVPPGTWTVTYSKTGYLSKTQTFTTTSSSSAVADVALSPIITLTTAPTAAVGTNAGFTLSAPLDPSTSYVILAGVSGGVPGFDVGTCHVALNPDIITDLFLNGLPLATGFTGVTSITGTASATLTIPPDPNLAGFTLFFLPVTIPSMSPVLIRAGSTTVPVTLTP